MVHDYRAFDGDRCRDEKCVSIDSTVAEDVVFQADVSITKTL